MTDEGCEHPRNAGRSWSNPNAAEPGSSIREAASALEVVLHKLGREARAKGERQGWGQGWGRGQHPGAQICKH